MGKSRRSNKTAPKELVVDVIHVSDPRLNQPVPDSDDEHRSYPRAKPKKAKKEKKSKKSKKEKKDKKDKLERIVVKPVEEETENELPNLESKVTLDEDKSEEIAPSQEEPKRKVSFEDGTAQVFDSAVAPRKIHEGSTETVPVPPETDEENQKSSENQGTTETDVNEEGVPPALVVQDISDLTSEEIQAQAEAAEKQAEEARGVEHSETEEGPSEAEETDDELGKKKSKKKKSMSKKWPKMKKPKPEGETEDEDNEKAAKKGKKTKKELKAEKAAKKAEAARKKKELHNLVDQVAASYSNSILDLRNHVKDIKEDHKENVELAKHHLGFLQTTVTRLDNIADDLKICDKIVDETTPSLLETFKSCREFLDATELALDAQFETGADELKTKVHQLDEHTKNIKGLKTGDKSIFESYHDNFGALNTRVENQEKALNEKLEQFEQSMQQYKEIHFENVKNKSSCEIL
ncbi:Oidioi.mRNA.OKI2018_I69.XSR.g15880.t1.cds [Oikopleura dioica]|uniref:Oidioi.mRNA.OKI2018_I69.XSR.g15880.t1.cds n=1 Tax=Oikopleura dioica TaxID=34765 RepID=A0ABN7SG58_OIKDI|nr:Oidioi.mRNA.OKI2018_I69.XSR.g15880.t1.cds [Oikopleura dioica]